MNRVLMIAFHYPPCAGTSGVHRTLKFTRYLPEYGWWPIVLSAHPRAHAVTDPGQLPEVSPAMPLVRAFAVDTARHLAVLRRYPRVLALPDRWATWWLGGVPAAIRLIRRYRPHAIWSTYPIATAHLIALTLHRLTRLPWIADFRDPMTENSYPDDRLVRRAHRWIETRTLRAASHAIFTTHSTRAMYVGRYPGLLSTERCSVISNGYDESDFSDLTAPPSDRAPDHRRIRVLHAGVMYPTERDPHALFEALSRLRRHGVVDPATVRIDLRATAADGYYSTMIRRMKLEDMIHLLPALPYREALQDSVTADALLLLQGPTCNRQVPAKVYEYLRVGKPILALTGAEGDTAAILKQTSGATILPIDDPAVLYDRLPRFFEAVRDGTHPIPDQREVSRFNRRTQAACLAACLGEVVGERSPAVPA